jgi:hypothetical protein
VTSVFEVLALRNAYAAARDALHRIVESASEGAAHAIRLHVDFRPAAPDANVLVTFERASEGTQFDEVWAVAWESSHDASFPAFEGLLAVRHTDGGAELEVCGEFAPPLHAAGQRFDLAAGQRIAIRTCRELLDELRRRIEIQESPAGRAGLSSTSSGS